MMGAVDTIVEFLLDDVLRYHARFESSDIPVEKGIRDKGLLEAAVNAPFQTYGGQNLLPTIPEKAARLCYGIANNHGFVDGNKRTAIHAMEMFLIMNGYELACDDYELERFIVKVADGSMTIDETTDWVNQNTSN